MHPGGGWYHNASAQNELADLNKATICGVSAAAKLPFGVGMKEKDQQGLSLSTS